MPKYYCKCCGQELTGEELEENKFCRNCGAEFTDETVSVHEENDETTDLFKKSQMCFLAAGIVGLVLEIIAAIKLIMYVYNQYADVQLALATDAQSTALIGTVGGLLLGALIEFTVCYIWGMIFNLFPNKVKSLRD